MSEQTLPNEDGVLTVDALPDSIVESILANVGVTSPERPSPDGGQSGEGGTPEPGGPVPEPVPPSSSEPPDPDDEEDEPEDGEVEDEPVAAETAGQPADVPAPPSTPTDPLVALLQDRLGDPAIRDGVTRLLLGQPATPPQPEPAPQVPQIQFSEEDLENPALRHLILVAAEQQRQLQQLSSRFDETAAQVQARQQAELANIATSAASAFQQASNIPDDLMTQIREEAGKHVYAAAQSVPADPQTGQPDTYRVIEKALDIAYWTLPAARRFDIERNNQNRQQALARKQKLAGIGGTSGSAPNRNPEPYDLTTEDGRYQAMVAEVAAHMNGTDQQ